MALNVYKDKKLGWKKALLCCQLGVLGWETCSLGSWLLKIFYWNIALNKYFSVNILMKNIVFLNFHLKMSRLFPKCWLDTGEVKGRTWCCFESGYADREKGPPKLEMMQQFWGPWCTAVQMFLPTEKILFSTLISRNIQQDNIFLNWPI